MQHHRWIHPYIDILGYYMINVPNIFPLRLEGIFECRMETITMMNQLKMNPCTKKRKEEKIVSIQAQTMNLLTVPSVSSAVILKVA